MNKFTHFIKKISGILFLEELLRTMKSIESLMLSIDASSKQLLGLPAVVEKALLATGKVQDLLGESIKEMVKAMQAVNENLKNIYDFSDEIGNGSHINIDTKIISGAGIVKNSSSTKSKDLYAACLANLGKNLCENHTYGAGETINNLFVFAGGKPITTSTSTMMILFNLQNDKENYIEIDSQSATPGDIIIVPTGESAEAIGNVGVIGEGKTIFVNNPDNGLLDNRLTIDEWTTFYSKLKMKTQIFRLK